MAIDNSDGRKQTFGALAAPHYKSTTTYVPKVQSFLLNTPLVTRNTVNYKEYKIGKPTETPLVKEYKGGHHDLIGKHLQIGLCNVCSSYPYL